VVGQRQAFTGLSTSFVAAVGCGWISDRETASFDYDFVTGHVMHVRPPPLSARARPLSASITQLAVEQATLLPALSIIIYKTLNFGKPSQQIT
jgi:hypothetical protein